MGGNGTLGDADAIEVGDLDVVAVSGGEEFVRPDPQAAAAILEASDRIEGRGPYSFVYDLRRDTSASGTYPVLLVSYSMACADYDDTDTAALVGNFLCFAARRPRRAARRRAGRRVRTDHRLAAGPAAARDRCHRCRFAAVAPGEVRRVETVPCGPATSSSSPPGRLARRIGRLQPTDRVRKEATR